MGTVKRYCEEFGQEHHISMTAENLIADIRARNEELEDVLRRIDTWAKAYPIKVFPKPDLAKAHKVLKVAGMTLDSISADNMRHVLDNIKDMVSDVLKE